MIGECVDYLSTIPQVARGELAQVLQEKATIDASQVQQMFPIYKSVEEVATGRKHPYADRIRKILSLIEIGTATHSQVQNDQNLGKMEDALKKKGDLKVELDQFESKQSLLMWVTIGFVAVWVIILSYCFITRKKSKDQSSNIEMDETEKKKLDHLTSTLSKMDEELVKMKEELKLLKERKKLESSY